jgi:NAD(P)-dependent dehydrogenase (short-subunit alcohol dehydrogenase family)
MNIIDLLKPRAGLRVFVSAGAAGIGAAIAEAFVQAQAKVYICDVNAAAVADARSRLPGLHAGIADVSDRAQVDAIIDDARQKLGGLDLLVNNAGIAGPTGAVEDLDPAQWESTVSTNLNSQFYFLRKAVPVLKETSECASIIAMSSVAGRLGYPFRTPYASTKWAIVGLVKSLAAELGPSNIRVNAILPGVVEGERMSKVIAARADALGISFDAMRDDLVPRVAGWRQYYGAGDQRRRECRVPVSLLIQTWISTLNRPSTG